MSPSVATGLRRVAEPAASYEKDDRGVWSITVGPLVPDFYSYAFNVDGVRTIDPKNAMIKQGETSLDSMFFVEGDEAAFEDNKPVPHGEIHIDWYQSSVLDKMRSMHVYTPPGYESGKEKYPVFYLLHDFAAGTRRSVAGGLTA